MHVPTGDPCEKTGHGLFAVFIMAKDQINEGCVSFAMLKAEKA